MWTGNNYVTEITFKNNFISENDGHKKSYPSIQRKIYRSILTILSIYLEGGKGNLSFIFRNNENNTENSF